MNFLYIDYYKLFFRRLNWFLFFLAVREKIILLYSVVLRVVLFKNIFKNFNWEVLIFFIRFYDSCSVVWRDFFLVYKVGFRSRWVVLFNDIVVSYVGVVILSEGNFIFYFNSLFYFEIIFNKKEGYFIYIKK